jgi:hypothetical protein
MILATDDGPADSTLGERVEAGLARDLHDCIVERPRATIEHHRCPFLPQFGQYHFPDPSLSASSNVFVRAWRPGSWCHPAALNFRIAATRAITGRSRFPQTSAEDVRQASQVTRR